MFKVFKARGHSLHGGTRCAHNQISKHLESADELALYDELDELVERAANGDVDIEAINICLEELDQKASTPFEADTNKALSTFHDKHGLLLEESYMLHLKYDSKKRPLAVKIVATCAAACLTISLIGTAYGIDLLDTIARWTTEVFHFAQSEVPYAEVGRYPIEIGETKEYDSPQQAADALELTAALMPTWIPDQYESSAISVRRTVSGISLFMCCESDDGSLILQFRESARKDQKLIETDDDIYQCYLSCGIEHYLVSDNGYTKILWANGRFECRANGDITEQEAKQIIDSIYERSSK